MKHPDQAVLALHAGGDLGWLQSWTTARHVARCGECRDEIAAFQGVREMMPELNEIPGLPWNRIADEMRANIHLGLAAGECVREAPSSRHALAHIPLFAGARMALAMGAVLALVVSGFVLERPTPSIMSAA